MDRKERLQNAWAVTDKPLIDIMTKKTQRLPSALINEDSSDGTSDSDSDSNHDFIALPEEFRPNLSTNEQSPQKQRNAATFSLTQTSENQLIHGPTTVKPTNNTPTSRFKNRNPTMSLQNDKEVSVKPNDTSLCKTGTSSKLQYEIVKTVVRQNDERCEEISDNHSKVKAKTLTQKKHNAVKDKELLLQQNAVSTSNMYQNEKSFKYEFVQKQERQTIHLNFDTLSFKDAGSVLKNGLRYETKLARDAYMSHQNATHGGNRIRKPNARKRSNLMVGQSCASSKENIVKWDSSLSLSYEQDSKIEWTLIRKKTSVQVRRDFTSRQFNNEVVSQNYHTNRVVSKNYNGKFNSPPSKCNSNQDTKPKTARKIDLEHTKPSKFNCKSLEKNLLSKNNKLKYNHISSSDSSSETESWDSGESRYCLQQRTPGRHNGGLVSRQSSSFDQPDLQRVHSCVDDHTYKRKMPLSDGNKEQYRQINKNKQVQDDLSLPAVPNFTRRENLDAKLSEDLEEKKESILRNGKEISDLIIGSYTALNVLISFYREWTIARRELIFQFEELGKHLKESAKGVSRWTDIIQIASSGAVIATAIPHPAASTAAKVVSLITGLLQSFLKTKKTDQANMDDSDEIARAMLKDTNTTSDLYTYGLQCSLQFEETTELIKKFHSNADIQGYFDSENPEITTFIRGFLEFKPNHRVFYKKLRKCFQELLQTSTADFSRRFCEPFTLYSSSAIDVIEHLDWRFRNDDFDGSSVRHELEEIHRLIQNSPDVDALQKRIRNCIAILKDELEFMESRIKEVSLFDSFSDSSKLFNK